MQPKESLARTRGIIPTLRFLFGMLCAIIHGLFIFRGVQSTVTIYGSARLPKTSTHYQIAYTLAYKIAKAGFPIMTGGGPSIMEAANKGSYDACGKSYGCNIVLPFEQQPNAFITLQYQTAFFFVRKFLLRHSSIAFIALPGGFGTLDELFETLTLIRTKSCDPFPVILIGKSYWSGLIAYLRETQISAGTISEEDLKQITVTDDLDEALDIIKAHAQDHD